MVARTLVSVLIVSWASLSLSADNWKPPAAHALIFCFSEPPLPGAGNPCEPAYDKPFAQAKTDIVYIAESAARPDRLEAAFCPALESRKDSILAVLIKGKLTQTAGQAEIDWIARDGRPGSNGKIAVPVILAAYGRCLERAQPQNVSTMLSGCLGGGEAWKLDLSGPRLFPGSIGTACCENAPDGEAGFRWSIGFALQTASAGHYQAGQDPFNSDEDDIPFAMNSERNPAACRTFWQAVLTKNMASILSEDQTEMPKANGCTEVPRVLREKHEAYARSCGLPPDDDQRGECTLAFVYYRAALRRWSSRDRAPASINDVEEVAENLIWSATGVPVGKSEGRRKLQLGFAKRLLEMRPQSAAAAGFVLNAVIPSTENAPRAEWLAVREPALKALDLVPSLQWSGRLQVSYSAFTVLTEGGKRELARQLERDWAKDPARAVHMEMLHSYVARGEPWGSHPHAIELMHEILK